jgi:hypothetical protein
MHVTDTVAWQLVLTAPVAVPQDPFVVLDAGWASEHRASQRLHRIEQFRQDGQTALAPRLQHGPVETGKWNEGVRKKVVIEAHSRNARQSVADAWVGLSIGAGGH